MSEKDEETQGEKAEVKRAIRKFYPDLLKILPLSHLVPCLYSEGMISSDSIRKLQALNELERIKYFLDDVLMPRVEIGYTTIFKKLLRVMQVSDDGAVKYLAGEICRFLSIDSMVSPCSSATPPFAPPTVTGMHFFKLTVYSTHMLTMA